MSVEAWLEAVVLLRLGAASCSGAVVAPDRVLTAWHCVAAGGRPSVEWRDGRRVVGRVVGADRRRDLALVEIPAGDRASLEVATAPPAVGSPVRALGHPLGGDLPEGFFAGTLRWSAIPGEVAAVGERALQLSAPLEPGSSGGPVVDGEGRVVGVVSRKLGGVAFAGRADAVAAGLRGEWGRGPGAVLSAVVVGVDQPAADGLLAGGGRLELAVADRVWFGAGGYVPAAPLLVAERRGAAESAVAEALGGLRLRLGRGPFSADLDGFGGVVGRQRWASDGAAARSTGVEATWTAGGRLTARGVGFELAAGADHLRVGIALRWPGTVAVW